MYQGVLAALQYFATGSPLGNVLKLNKRSSGRSIHAVANGLCKIAPQHFSMNPNLLFVSLVLLQFTSKCFFSLLY